MIETKLKKSQKAPTARRGIPVMLAMSLIASIVGMATASADSPFPTQLEMRVPFQPTAFPSSGHSYLCYELYLTNFSNAPMTLRRLDILDGNTATATAAKPLVSFEGQAFDSMLQSVGAAGDTGNAANIRVLNPGATDIVFVWIALDAGAPTPGKLRHRILTMDETEADGATINTHTSELQVLSPPVQGNNWWAADGPSNSPDNHHRRGVIVLNAVPSISRRYAIDWIKQEKGVAFKGNPADNHAYFAYGQPVFAVADATVVASVDGMPDNEPRHSNTWHTAVPITIDNVGGNFIVLDLGHGQFAHYFHLQPGSVHVKPGSHVARGEMIGKVGASGDARAAHLHFEVTTSATTLVGEGVPYVIDRYQLQVSKTRPTPHVGELPLGESVVDFTPAH